MRALAIGMTLLWAICGGCKPEIPDATFACKKDEDCPSGQFCHASDDLCHRERENARPRGGGKDGGPKKDSGAAQPEDAGAMDGASGIDSGGSDGSAPLGPCVLDTSSIDDCVLE